MSETARKTILIVDDEEQIRKFLCQLLNKTYSILSADSGEAALKQSREFEGAIDLMISNIQMPGMTGLELGTKITLERPKIRVLLISGFTSGMLVLNEGWHFLHKPFIPAQLLAIVLTVLNSEFPVPAPDLNEHRIATASPEAVKNSGLDFLDGSPALGAIPKSS